GADTLDFVYQDIRSAGDPAPPRRVWLLTAAKAPALRFDDLALAVQAKGATLPDGRRWLDFGVATELVRDHGRFGQIRITGVGIEEARESLLLITEDTGAEPSGDRDAVETQFFGIRRRDVGRTTLSPSRVPAGEPTEFELTYICGAEGLPAGARLRFGCPFFLSPPQGDDPDSDGACVVIESTSPVELIGSEPAPESHEKRDIHYRLPEGLPPEGRVRLRYRTATMWLPAGVRVGVERRYWYSPIAPLTVGAAVQEGAPFVPPLDEHGHQLEILAGPPERLHLFVPGRRREDKPLRLTGILTDRYRNLAPHPVRLRARLRVVGDDPAELPGPDGAFTHPHRFVVDLPPLSPGVHRVEAVDEDTGRVLAVSNPLEILAEDDPRPPVYWGEIHGHCAMSDGYGSFNELLAHARDVAALDFAASADHVCYFSDNEWAWMQDVNNTTNDPGSFVTLNGYEWAGAQGHRNIHTSGDRLALYRGMYAPTRDLGAVYEALHGRTDVVAGPHTCHTGPFHDRHDPAVERYLEIYSVWGVFDELAWEILNAGARIGFTGGGDVHDARCGFSTDNRARPEASSGFFPGLRWPCGATGAYLDTLDRKHVVQALRDRQIYATTGARILLDVSVSGIPMGEDGAAEAARLHATVHACGPLARIEIIRNGEVAHTVTNGGTDTSIDWSDPTPPGESTWYVLKVVQDDEEMAWSSPIWVASS
ncbi:MAG: CehA/McbA family metallohydrolase, partial [Planctomycetota bacterium]